MQRFTHKEHTILLGDTGHFHCTVGRTTHRTTSLDGMKKKLDKLAGFALFPVLVNKMYSSEYVTRNVVGIRTARGHKHFMLDDGSEQERVRPDTPENRKAIDTYAELRAKNRELRNAMEKAERELAVAIIYKRPE